MQPHSIIDVTRRWIAEMVIGLNLCPFARRVFEGDKIRYVVTEAAEQATVLAALGDELRLLSDVPIEEVETTLLILAGVRGSFLDYLDVVDAGERLVADIGLRGEIQLASFHPDYQFAGAAADDPANYTNRSPFPMIHLLREESVSAVAGDQDQLLAIPEQNIATLRRLGRAHILEKLKAIHDG